MLRLFIGIPVPASAPLRRLLDELRQAAADPAKGLRLVKDENLHVTLHFIGAAPAESVPEVGALMERELASFSSFTTQLAGAGYFRSALWAGVEPHPTLSAMAAVLRTAFAPTGEEQRFRPHVTLARLTRTAAFNVRDWALVHRHDDIATLHVDAVHLYRSETLPSGARYSVLHATCLRRT